MPPEKPTNLIHSRLWERRRAHYVAVFERALVLLREKPALPEPEPNLTRELYFLTVKARRELDPRGRYGSPVFESQSLPDPDEEAPKPHERKVPDAQWRHDDESAPDDRHREKSFVIECKRLGQPTASGWKLNEKYVTAGIARFHSPDYRYGQHMHEGMMIGFVQNMELPDILSEVGRHLSAACMPALQLQGELAPASISRFNQTITRSFPINPFHLHHRWIDLRGVPLKPTPVRPGEAKKGTSADGIQGPQIQGLSVRDGKSESKFSGFEAGKISACPAAL